MRIRIFIVIALTSVLFGCVLNTKKDTPKKDTIEMGVILPKCENEKIVQEIKNAMIFSAEEFNLTQKSPKINLLFLDIDNTKESLYTALEVLKIRNVDIIHAGFTNQCAFELKMFENTNALVNFFSQYPPIATQTNNAIRIFLNAAQVCEEMTKEIKPAKIIDKKSEIILAEDSILGKSCTEYLKFQTGDRNIKIFTESFSPNEENFDLLAKNITQSKIDYVIIFASENKLQTILNSLSKFNFNGEIYANCPLLNSDIKFKNLKIVKSAFEMNKTNAGATFKSSYKNRYGTLPSLAAALAYDSVKITATAFLNSAKDPSATKKYLSNKTIEGVAGQIKFDSYGDTTLSLELCK